MTVSSPFTKIHLTNLGWVITYLASTGAITEEDLYLMLEAHPKLETVLLNYPYFAKKYRPSIVRRYINEILNKFKRKDVISQLKLVTVMLTYVPENRLKILAPYIAQIVANVERQIIEQGLMDSKLEKIFEKLYDALYKEKPRIPEITTMLLRIMAHTSAAVKSVEHEVRTVTTEYTKPRKSFYRKNIDEELLKEFVKMIYEFNKQRKYPLVAEALNEFFAKHSDILGSIAEAYTVLRECLSRGYIEEKAKRLYITEEGKRFIGV